MSSSIMKVESGLQLLARLTRKKDIRNFYPHLFDQGPHNGDIIELYSEQSTKHLLEDIIAESLLPIEIGGKEAGVLILNIDGHLSFNDLVNIIKNKLYKRKQPSSSLDHHKEIKQLLNRILKNLYVIEVEDLDKFYITIQNLQNILSKHSDISIIIFDTLTAFYWSEQYFKITKMDLYLKKLLLNIQKITREYKVTILYTRPQYFSSTKGLIENLEQCYEYSSDERINYRIQVVYNNNGNNFVNIQNHKHIRKREFQIYNGEFTWV